jgi:adenine deaminase
MRKTLCILIPLIFACVVGPSAAQPPDLILHHGKIVSVDEKFTVTEAIAVRGERIVAVGKNDDVLKMKGKTRVIDGGKMVCRADGLMSIQWGGHA